MKKILSTIMSMILVLAISTSCIYAQDLTLKSASDIIAESFLEELDTDLDIEYSTPLYDGTDEINGYWYHLGNNDGYMIIFNWGGDLKVLEYSLDGDLGINPNVKTYYDGLVSYYQEDVQNVMSVSNVSFSLDKSELYKAPDLDMSKVNKSVYQARSGGTKTRAASLNATLDHLMTHIYQGSVTGTGYDPFTLCTQTSSAMIIRYHASFNGKSGLADNYGVSLVKDILPYMEPDNSNGSTSLAKFKSGLTDYVRTKGYSASVTYQISDEYGNSISSNYPNTIYQDILNERPGLVVVGSNAVTDKGEHFVSNASTLHAMAVYGITTKSNNFYLQVNDPLVNVSGSARKLLLWDTYPYPGNPSAIYAVGRVIIS